MTHIRMILKHLCLAIDDLKNLICRIKFAPIVMFYVVNFPNFDVKSIIFPNFGQGPFPKIAK